MGHIHLEVVILVLLALLQVSYMHTFPCACVLFSFFNVGYQKGSTHREDSRHQSIERHQNHSRQKNPHRSRSPHSSRSTHKSRSTHRSRSHHRSQSYYRSQSPQKLRSPHYRSGQKIGIDTIKTVVALPRHTNPIRKVVFKLLTH